MISHNFFLIIGILYAIFAFITITFSLTVIIIIVYYWRSKCRSTANLFTCHSAVAVLFYATTLSIQIPSVIQSDPLHVDKMNTNFCKIRSFIATYATLVKAYSYLGMAISCFFITILYRRRWLLSFRVNWLVIITSWIFSGIITIGTYFSPLAYAYELESGLCFLTTKNFPTSFTVVTLVFVLTLGTMIILYGIIIWHITRYNQIDPNSRRTLRAKRNMKVFKKIFIFVSILLIGGTPYFLCSLLHRIDRAPWPFYAIAHLFISFSAALESIALLFTNGQVKAILLNKLYCQQETSPGAEITMTVNKIAQVMPHHNRTRTIEQLPNID